MYVIVMGFSRLWQVFKAGFTKTTKRSVKYFGFLGGILYVVSIFSDKSEIQDVGCLAVGWSLSRQVYFSSQTALS